MPPPNVLPIVLLPDPVLRAPTAKVKIFDEGLTDLVQTMRTTMHAASGVGLAAPQIGQLLKLAVMEYDPTRFRDDGEPTEPPIPFQVIINPTITSLGKIVRMVEEGCLSIPEVAVMVPRATEVTVLALNERGERVRIRAKGFLARILQHEIDHLHGILIVDRVVKGKK